MPDRELPALAGPLAGLDATARAELVRIGRWVGHEPGDVLMRQGARTRALFVVADGLVTVSVTTREGRELLFGLLGPGDTVGELSAIDGAARSATVTARSPVQALRVDGDAFVGFLRARPDAMLALLRVLSGRLRDSDRARVELAVSQTGPRVARRLLELAADHGRLVDGRIEIGLALTQAELAAWVGASREGVSEALGALRQAGILATGRRTLAILDLPGLRDRALA